MFKKIPISKTSIDTNTSVEGETIEAKVRRITTNKEPITDGAPLIYTERKNGAEAQYDIRTDRFEIAVEAMDKVAKTYKARREERIKNETEEKNPGENNKKESEKDTPDSRAKPIETTE